MGLSKPPPELATFGLRAMKTVAMADGNFDERERATLAAARDALDSTADLDALAPIEPAELAAAIQPESLRQQVIAGLMVVALADETASDTEIAAIERFAAALDIDGPYVKNLRRLAERHTMIMRFDLVRRLAPATLAGIKEDTATAQRYRALEHAPAGSLGRAYFDFMRTNHFALPGEQGSPPEPIALHDLAHALTGYGTDPEGELQVAFFHAGCKKEDAFFFTFFAMLQFHLEIRQVASGGRGDPAREMAALTRGARSTIDPLDGWDPWTVMTEPLEALRQRYNISGL